jgi:hypothetical protein
MKPPGLSATGRRCLARRGVRRSTDSGQGGRPTARSTRHAIRSGRVVECLPDRGGQAACQPLPVQGPEHSLSLMVGSPLRAGLTRDTPGTGPAGVGVSRGGRDENRRGSCRVSGVRAMRVPGPGGVSDLWRGGAAVRSQPDDELREQVRRAAAACPVQAIAVDVEQR